MEYVEDTEPGASVLLPAFIKKQDWEAFNLTELKGICKKLRVDADFSDKLKVCEVLSQFEFTSSYAAEIIALAYAPIDLGDDRWTLQRFSKFLNNVGIKCEPGFIEAATIYNAQKLEAIKDILSFNEKTL